MGNHEHTNKAVRSGDPKCRLFGQYTCWPVRQIAFLKLSWSKLVKCLLTKKDIKWKWVPTWSMSSWQKRQNGFVNFLPGHRLTDHVGHKFIINLCLNWPTKHSPIKTKHKSLYVLFGYIVVNREGKVIFIQSCPFWSILHTPIRSLCVWKYLVLSFLSTRVLTSKDIFCKGIIVLEGHDFATQSIVPKLWDHSLSHQRMT